MVSVWDKVGTANAWDAATSNVDTWGEAERKASPLYAERRQKVADIKTAFGFDFAERATAIAKDIEGRRQMDLLLGRPADIDIFGMTDTEKRMSTSQYQQAAGKITPEQRAAKKEKINDAIITSMSQEQAEYMAKTVKDNPTDFPTDFGDRLEREAAVKKQMSAIRDSSNPMLLATSILQTEGPFKVTSKMIGMDIWAQGIAEDVKGYGIAIEAAKRTVLEMRGEKEGFWNQLALASPEIVKSVEEYSLAHAGLSMAPGFAKLSTPMQVGITAGTTEALSAEDISLAERAKNTLFGFESGFAVGLAFDALSAAYHKIKGVYKISDRDKMVSFLRRHVDALKTRTDEEILAAFSKLVDKEPGLYNLLKRRGTALDAQLINPDSVNPSYWRRYKGMADITPFEEGGKKIVKGIEKARKAKGEIAAGAIEAAKVGISGKAKVSMPSSVQGEFLHWSKLGSDPDASPKVSAFLDKLKKHAGTEIASDSASGTIWRGTIDAETKQALIDYANLKNQKSLERYPDGSGYGTVASKNVLNWLNKVAQPPQAVTEPTQLSAAKTDIEKTSFSSSAGAAEAAKLQEAAPIGGQPDQLPAVTYESVPDRPSGIIKRLSGDLQMPATQEIIDVAASTPPPDELLPGIEDEDSGDIIRYKKPLGEIGLSYLITSKKTVMEVIGAMPTLKDVEAGRLAADLELRDISSWLDKTLKHLRSKDPITGRLKRWIRGKQSESIEKMRDILDNYIDIDVIDTTKAVTKEEADLINKGYVPLRPAREGVPITWLPRDEAEILTKTRALLDYLRVRANIVRSKMGLDPIEYVSGYIHHWMDAVTKAVLGKKYPLQHGYIKEIMRKLPTVTDENVTALHRQVLTDLENYFSKDLGKLIREMARYDLYDIYITQPRSIAIEEFKNMKMSKITNDLITDYINYDIDRARTKGDIFVDISLGKPTALINKALNPVGRNIRSMSSSLFPALRYITHLHFIGGRVKLLTRNPTQRLLLLDLVNGRDFMKGQFLGNPTIEHPITGESVKFLDWLREQDFYKETLHKWADLPDGKRILGWLMYPYQRTHVGIPVISNVEVSAATGYYDHMRNVRLSNDVNSRLYKGATKMAADICKREAQLAGVDADKYTNKFLDEVRNKLLYYKEDTPKAVRDMIQRTQWEYFMTSLPTVLRGQSARAALALNSWWMNWYGVHMRENVTRLFTGRTIDGKYVGKMARFRALKGIGFLTALSRVVTSLWGIKTLEYLLWPEPGVETPMGDTATGIVKYLYSFVAPGGAEARKRTKKDANRKLISLKSLYAPGALAAKDLWELMTRKKSAREFFFHTVKEEGGRPERPEMPERPTRPERP